MSVYNAHQQIFQLSLMAFLSTGIRGTQRNLQTFVEGRLPRLLEHLPGWEIVWGPVVWKFFPEDDRTPPDHVCFVVKNAKLVFSNGEEKETYVLSIAGTQTNYNWVVNNGRVDEVVDFHEWLERGLTTRPRLAVSTSPENCYIALGTALGVHQLATIVPPLKAASPGVEIPTYWASFPESPNTRVIVTGHSLGGALSPTFALGLLESRAFDKFSPSNILVYPTAGPTAGNLVFAKLFADRFPKVRGPRYEVWNCMIVNLRDPIAHAWCTSQKKSPKQNMSHIPTIFGEPPLLEVQLGVAAGRALANSSTVTYIPIPAVWFEGTPRPSPPPDMKAFLKLVRQQHTDELLNLMQMEAIRALDLPGELEAAGVERIPSPEATSTEPVICELIAQSETQEEEEGDSEDYQSIRALSESCAM